MYFQAFLFRVNTQLYLKFTNLKFLWFVFVVVILYGYELCFSHITL